MRTHYAAMLALLTAACGPQLDFSQPDPTSPSGLSGPGAAPTQTIPLPISADAALARVVVRRFTADTPAKEVFKYIVDVDPATSSIPLPNGDNYTIEVFAGGDFDPVTSSRKILEYYKTGTFNIPTQTAPEFALVTLAPQFTFPPIYAGLLAPYNTYKVTYTNVTYPFAQTNWTLRTAYVIDAETSIEAFGVRSSGSLKFTAPPVSVTGPLTFTATFYLDSTLLNGSPAKSWYFEFPYADVEVTPSTNVIVIPTDPPAPTP